MRLRRWVPRPIKAWIKTRCRDLAGAPSRLVIGQFGGFDVAYRAGTSDEQVIDESFGRDIFFSDLPEYHPNDDHTIVDVGAHIGTFAMMASRRVPHGRVFAVEASRETHHLLRINVALNRLDNVRVDRLALSDTVGTTTLFHDEENWGHSIVAPLTGRGETVPTQTLAGYFADCGIERTHLLKFNCEGAEFPILLGSSIDVLRTVETMLVLYHTDLYRWATLSQLKEHLERAGFSTTVRNSNAERGWLICVR